jgi:hypothetical protein
MSPNSLEIGLLGVYMWQSIPSKFAAALDAMDLRVNSSRNKKVG